MKRLLLFPLAALLLNGCSFDDKYPFYKCSIFVQKHYSATMKQADKVCSEITDTPYISTLYFHYFNSPSSSYDRVPVEQCARLVSSKYPDLSSESVSVLCSPRFLY